MGLGNRGLGPQKALSPKSLLPEGFGPRRAWSPKGLGSKGFSPRILKGLVPEGLDQRYLEHFEIFGIIEIFIDQECEKFRIA